MADRRPRREMRVHRAFAQPRSEYGDVEFFVDMVTTVPEGTSEDEVADMRTREAARSAS
ncbi:hypothetical protein GCM10027614_23800 [Micromonospora vulcania]